jgi:glycosyltransferase involved in cell wall biosynthesis
MTVLVVMPVGEQRGGAEVMLRHLVLHRPEGGVDWVVIFLEHGPMVGELARHGVTVVVVEAGRMRQPLRVMATIARISRLARETRATLVLGWMSKGQVYGGAAALLARRPAVWYQLGTADPRDWLVRIATALPARGIISLSESAAASQLAIRPARPQRLVYPGVELDCFDCRRLAPPSKIRGRLGLRSDGPLIGIVARLQRWKGVHVLIDALALLRASHPRAHCVIVGGAHGLEPAYPSELLRQTTALGLDRHVTFAGLRSDAADWMQAMDIIVHASDREPFGIVVIEAMALGKPVIAGAEGGPREIITHGVNGLLVRYGDSVALAAALRRYLDDPEFASRVGVAARARAAQFSASQFASNVVTALEELTA